MAMHIQKSVLQEEDCDGCNVEIAEKHFIMLSCGCSRRKRGLWSFPRVPAAEGTRAGVRRGAPATQLLFGKSEKFKIQVCG